MSDTRTAPPTSESLPSAHPEVWSSAAEHLSREGMVTVWDDQGRYVGCMGVNLWRVLLDAKVSDA